MKTRKRFDTNTKVLFLWCIGGTVLLTLILSPMDYAATTKPSDQAATGLPVHTLPTLMPDGLLQFDPVHYLIRAQIEEDRFQRAAVAMADTEYSIALRRIETAAEKTAMHGETLFYPIIFEAAYRYEVDPAMVKAIILAESSYNARAVSNRGARGLMQLMPITAREMGVKNNFSPRQNIHAGTAYFKKLLNRYDGDVKLALAAYNAGSARVKQYKGVPPFKATRTYIEKVLHYHRIYSKQSRRIQKLSAERS
jgi:soluble lytic murein transglycosylase-like protein